MAFFRIYVKFQGCNFHSPTKGIPPPENGRPSPQKRDHVLMERTVFQALFCREYMIAQWSTSTVIRHLRQLQEPSKCPFFHNHRCGKWSERKPPSVFSNLSSRIWNFPPSCCPATASMNMPFPDRCWQPRWPRRRHSAASGTRHKGHGHGDGTRRSRRFVGMKKKRNKLQKNRTRPCATVEMEMEPSRPTR